MRWSVVPKFEAKQAVEHWKAKGLDFSKILYQPEVGDDVGRYCQIPQDHGLDKSLDMTVLLDLCQAAIVDGEPVQETIPIKNINRAVGTILGNEITKRHWEGLPDDTVHLHFKVRLVKLRRIRSLWCDDGTRRRYQRLPRQRTKRR